MCAQPNDPALRKLNEAEHRIREVALGIRLEIIHSWFQFSGKRGEERASKLDYALYPNIFLMISRYFEDHKLPSTEAQLDELLLTLHPQFLRDLLREFTNPDNHLRLHIRNRSNEVMKKVQTARKRGQHVNLVGISQAYTATLESDAFHILLLYGRGQDLDAIIGDLKLASTRRQLADKLRILWDGLFDAIERGITYPKT